MIRRWTVCAAISGGLFLAATDVRAQPRDAFGQKGQFIVSADRLFPLLSYTHVSQDGAPPPGNSKEVATLNEASISLLWGSSSAPATGSNAATQAQDTFFTVPRVGFDYVIVPRVTVGGDLVFFFTLGGNASTDTTTNGGVTTTTTVGNPSALVFGVAPRGGYILPLSDMFAVWLRGGFSYYVGNTKDSTPNGVTFLYSTNQFAIDLDPQFVITPIPHLGFTLGLTADIPIVGNHSLETDQNAASTTVSFSSSILFFGATAGMLGYF